MAKINFRQKAIENLTLSDLMKEREKLETEKLIELHNGKVTITDFDICELVKNDKKEVVACYVVAEEPKYFMFAGKLLKDTFEDFIKEYDGDIDACREDFRLSGGLNVKLERTKTSNNQPITKVTIL